MDESAGKSPIHKTIMATQDEYVNNNMFDPDEAIAAAVNKRKFLINESKHYRAKDKLLPQLNACNEEAIS